MSRNSKPKPDREMVQFIGFSEKEIDLFITLTERYDVGLAQLADMMKKEVMKQVCDPEEDYDNLLKTINAKSRDGLRLDADTDLLVAIDEAKRDMHAGRLSASPGPSLKELLDMHRRAVNWFWFWSVRHPLASERPRFAAMAAEREAEMEAILAKRKRSDVQ